MTVSYIQKSLRNWDHTARLAQLCFGKRPAPGPQIWPSIPRPLTTSSFSQYHNTIANTDSTQPLGLDEQIIGTDVNNSRATSNKRERQTGGNREQDETCYARLVPESPSYFSVQPKFIDSLVSLDQILEKYKTLPVSTPGDAPKTAWLSVHDYRNMVGEKVKNTRYQHVLRVLKRLNQIHPLYVPTEVNEAIQSFKRDIIPEVASTRISSIDKLGRSLGIGRRKSATGRAWLVEGTGNVLVNGKTLDEAFGRIHDRETIIWPLKTTGRIDKYNIWCRVQGGGTTGQAEALTLAVARALLGHEPALKPALRRAGCVTRDPRKVERKKPGRLKARKKPAWVKR